MSFLGNDDRAPRAQATVRNWRSTALTRSNQLFSLVKAHIIAPTFVVVAERPEQGSVDGWPHDPKPADRRVIAPATAD